MATGHRGKGEGSIYRRYDGLWVGSVDLGLQGGRRRRKVAYGKTQKEVRDKLRALQRTLEAGTIPAPANLTVGRYLEDWLTRFLPGTVSPRTESIYRNAIDRYVTPTLGSVKLRQLSPAHVSEMLSTLESQGYAPETRRIARAVLRRAIRRAEQEGIVSRNVAAIADGVKIPRREGRTLTPEQAQAFLREVKGDRLEAAYVVALALGLRRGELLGISWDDVTLDRSMPLVRIRRQLLRHGGRGVLLADLKTAGSRRTLHLSQPLVDLLRTHRVRQDAEQQEARVWRNPANLVFTSTIGTPLDPEAFGRTVPRICKRAGLGHWSIHELRHSCASLLLAMGVPLEVVSETLGHASIRVTMDVYGHLLAPSRMHAAEAMRRALWLNELPDFDPLATELATNVAEDDTDNMLNWDSVGRPGLDPGTLGLKVPCSSG
jgi:integrase